MPKTLTVFYKQIFLRFTCNKFKRNQKTPTKKEPLKKGSFFRLFLNKPAKDLSPYAALYNEQASFFYKAVI
ncbi:hypothetical protein PAENIP36_00190 [Paenibacillus sp. P36]